MTRFIAGASIVARAAPDEMRLQHSWRATTRNGLTPIMSWKGFKRGWSELRQSELSWTVAKRSMNELTHPPKREITTEERTQRARRSELGFPMFLLSYSKRDEPSARRRKQDEQKADHDG